MISVNIIAKLKCIVRSWVIFGERGGNVVIFSHLVTSLGFTMICLFVSGDDTFWFYGDVHTNYVVSQNFQITSKTLEINRSRQAIIPRYQQVYSTLSDNRERRSRTW